MNAMEIRDRRVITPNVRLISRDVMIQFAACFKAGMGLGLMLFTAFTTFSVLSHGAVWIEGAAKQSQPKEAAQSRNSVIPKVGYVVPYRVLRNTAVVQKSQDDYRMFREQARLVTDLTNELSRTVSRFAR